MDWESVLKIVTAAITSIGGAGVIIWAIVRFAANHLSEKMLRKYDAKLDKEIEQYKHTLELETERYRKKAEKLTFVSKIQFETEFSAYKALFEYLFDFSNSTRSLFPIMDKLPADEHEEKEEYRRRYSSFVNAYNKFSEVLEKNAPFIPIENYEMFASLRKQADDIGRMFPEIRIIDNPAYRESYVKIADKNYDKTILFEKDIETAKIKIRDYLATLKVEKE